MGRQQARFAVSCRAMALLHTAAVAFVHPPRAFVSTRASTTTTMKPFAQQPQHMTLIPLPVEEMDRLLVTGVPTAAQYSTYWGRSSREKYGALLEASIVTLLGVFMSYFLSFVLGSFVASLLGSLSAMWIILSPELRAYQRNWELRGGRELVDPWIIGEDEDEDKQGLYGCFFLGRIKDVCVVEEATSTEEYDLDEFLDYNMETDDLEKYTGNPYLLRVQMHDKEGRDLQVHSRMSEEYLDLQVDQPIIGVLLSTSQKFSTLAALTDFYVPDVSCWIGDYPYLDRNELERLLGEDDDLWGVLESQGVDNDDVDRGYYDDMDDGDYDDQEFDNAGERPRYAKVAVRRQRRR